MLRIIINISLFFSLITSTLFCTAQINAYSIKKIVIDAGHGGKDPGAAIGKTYEKDIVLDVALKTGKLIKKMYPDIQIIYTRDCDVFIPLMDRADIANKQKADLFLSIHANIGSNESTSGSETYILGQHRSQENLDVAKLENSVILLEDDYSTRYEGFDPNLAESYIMFELIQNEFLELSRLFADRVQNHFVSHAKRKDRGVRQAGFLVLRKTAMPSILIELGFMSNKSEIDFMVKETGRTQLAESIFKAFSDYKHRFDERSASSVQQTASVSPATNEASVNSANHKALNTSSTPAGSSNQKNTVTQTTPVTPASSESQKTSSTTSAPVASPSSSSSKTTAASTGTNQIQSDSLINASLLKGKWYGVQIIALKNKLTVKDKVFKNHTPVCFLVENGVYKYFLGLTQDSAEINKTFHAMKSDFNGCFLVSFTDGQKKSIK